MPHQVALTVRARILPGQTEALKQLLNAIDAEERRPDLLPFEELPVHFARLFVLDETSDLDGATIPASLVFLSDIDAPLEGYLTQLARLASRGLDEIFRHCEGYPSGPDVTPDQRARYLRAKKVQASTFYANTVGRSLAQVRQEASLRTAIEEFLDRPGKDWAEATPAEVRAAIQRFVRDDATVSWAMRPASPPETLWRCKETLHMVVVPLIVLLLLPLVLLALPLWLILLRIHEKRDIVGQVAVDRARLEELVAREDRIVQNQFTAMGFRKPGDFRRLTLTLVLWILSYGARHLFTRGSLAGVRTIHFARWIFFDDKRRLLFASNYDGSLESYMDDFIDKVAYGLNAVFSNGVGYPKTNWLVQDGARDELAFKNLLRARQLDTPVWYSAYGDLSALNIANNASIRAGLFGDMSPAEAAIWTGYL